jgi:hypothetical protein
MRGGRSQPKEVSRSTYHAHAHLRVASYDDFISQQTHLQPNHPGMQQGLGNGARNLSPAPTTSHTNKRRRNDLSEENERSLQHITTITGTAMGQLEPGEGIEVQGGESVEADETGENTYRSPDTLALVSILR